MRSQNAVLRSAAVALASAVALLGVSPLAGGTAWGQSFGVIGAHLSHVQLRDATDASYLGGVHAELRPIPMLGFNASVDFRSDQEFKIQSGTTTSSLNVRTIPMTLSGKLFLPIAPMITPYGLVGAGWYHQVFDFSPDLEALGIRDHNETTFAWHVGFGANLNLQPRFGVYADARWIFLDPNRNVDAQTTDQIKNFDFNSVNLQAGVNFMF